MTATFEEGTAFAELQKRLVLSKEEMAEQRVLNILEDVFSPMGPFKGNIYFSDGADLVQEVKNRVAFIKGKK